MPISGFTTTNVIQTPVLTYFEGVGQVDPSWSKLFKRHTDNEGALRISPLSGIDTIPTWDGNADVTTSAVGVPGSNNGLTLTYAQRAVRIRLRKLQLRDVKGLLDMTMAKLGFATGHQYAALAWTVVANVLNAATETYTEPDGTGAKALIATNHSTLGATRSNALTTALDRTAFLTAIRMSREWLNYNDQQLDWAAAPKFLVVPAELEGTAKQILQSSVTSDQLQRNTAVDYNTSIIVAPWLTDANNWGLFVDPSWPDGNMHHWERAMPEVAVTTDFDSLHTQITVDFATVFDAGPLPDGMIGATVA